MRPQYYFKLLVLVEEVSWGQKPLPSAQDESIERISCELQESAKHIDLMEGLVSRGHNGIIPAIESPYVHPKHGPTIHNIDRSSSDFLCRI